MAQLIDTSVFIALERSRLSVDHLRGSMPGESAALAVVTASEMLAGVYRADTPEPRARREAFVEEVLATLPVIAFDLSVARLYARIGEDMRAMGRPVGAHDLQIAATALAHGYTVA